MDNFIVDFIHMLHDGKILLLHSRADVFARSRSRRLLLNLFTALFKEFTMFRLRRLASQIANLALPSRQSSFIMLGARVKLLSANLSAIPKRCGRVP